MKFLIKLYVVLFILFSVGCGEKCIKHYTFDVPLEVSPMQSTLKVGDTLQIRMITDNQAIYDTFGNRVVRFPNFDPNGIFQLPLIDTFPVKEGLTLNEILVDTSLYKAQIRNTEHLGLGLFFFGIPKNENESRIEFKVVLKTPGLYMLVCRSAMYVNGKKLVFPDRCGNKGILLVHFNILQGDHINILNKTHFEILDKFWINSSAEKHESDNYYFRVLE